MTEAANASTVASGNALEDPRGPDEPALYAALDLGTNNCRLLIAARHARGFRIVDAYSRIVRLGEGVSPSLTIRE